MKTYIIDGQEYVTAGELAKERGTLLPSVFTLAERQKFTSIKVGNTRLYLLVDYEAYARKRRQKLLRISFAVDGDILKILDRLTAGEETRTQVMCKALRYYDEHVS